MWQDLFDTLQDQGFVIIAVALDANPEDARPWIDQATPTYPVLIDRDHVVADLYNLVNVPQAVWIDEVGQIVRPPETAGVYEAFRSLDRTTMTVPESETAKAKSARAVYLAALRDWVTNGRESAFVMSGAEGRAQTSLPSTESAEAHTIFRLALYLLRIGRQEEAQRHAMEASHLNPKSWAMWRQFAEKTDAGLAASPAFWERVEALGDARYYPPPPIPDMP